MAISRPWQIAVELARQNMLKLIEVSPQNDKASLYQEIDR